jgi:hypothetical protein
MGALAYLCTPETWWKSPGFNSCDGCRLKQGEHDERSPQPAGSSITPAATAKERPELADSADRRPGRCLTGAVATSAMSQYGDG